MARAIARALAHRISCRIAHRIARRIAGRVADPGGSLGRLLGLPAVSPVRPLALLLCLALSACAIPRGAGFQSEVLAQARAQEDGTPAAEDFTVVEVTRATQDLVGYWPHVGPRSYDWIRRQAQPPSMIIATGDVISVTVWDAEDNSLLAAPGVRVAQLEDAQVSSEGRIFLPFVGDLRVSGMSVATARERIEERYAETIPSAQVQIQVAPGRGNTANLVGGVTAPGVYPLVDRDVTILGLLSLGGGVTPGLENPQVRLFRGTEIYGVSVDRLFEDPALDTTLQGGDRVIVEEEERYFLSLGAAGTEAEHVFPRDHVTALDAMSIIGGVSDFRADPQGILILREYPLDAVRYDGSGPPQSRVVFTLDLTTADGLFSARNFEIMSGDLVYATESPVTAAQTIIGLLGSGLGVAARVQTN